jgi:NTE family protein
MTRSLISCFFTCILVCFIEFNLDAQSVQNPGKHVRPKVGLVFSGGGAKGFAYIGLLKVIQESGLPVDYIGGSSIGSIIGGLYAVGYAPDSIARMIRSQNWDDLLKDVIDRKYIAYEEKEFCEKSIVRIPFKKKAFTLGPSLYNGQEIELLLNYYFSPAAGIHDFHKLQIPFLCIGTDLITGESVTLDKGYLPMAIRSSMAIPGYFSPVEYNGHFLVDGGVVNNYPVKEVKEMGAQIIIGGDVQSGLLETKEQLNTVPAILDQITSFARVGANKVGDSLTDIHVRMKMSYGIMDFDGYDSIIAFGEEVAEKYRKQIKALADSLNSIEYRPMKHFMASPPDSVPADTVIIRGNKKVPQKYFNTFIRLPNRSMICQEDLRDRVRQAYGSGLFNHVTYEIDSIDRMNALVVKVEEGGPGYVSAGIHYDNNYNGSLLLTAAFRDVLGRQTKLLANLVLGVNPRLKADYLVGLGGNAGFGAGIDFYNLTFDLYDGDVKINKITYSNLKSSVFFSSTVRNNLNFRAGFDYEYFRFRQDVLADSTLEPYSDFSSYGTIFLSLNADTRDRPWFPTRGLSAAMRLEYVMPLSANWSRELFNNSAILYLKYDHNFPLSRRFVLQPGLFAGGLLQRSAQPPVQHLFAFGGLNPENYVDPYVPFTGVHFLQKFGYYAGIVRMKLQYNYYKKLFVTLRADGGSNEMDFDELFNGRSMICGYGITASYNSFIGPIELSVMGSNLNPSPVYFLNIGFWF